MQSQPHGCHPKHVAEPQPYGKQETLSALWGLVGLGVVVGEGSFSPRHLAVIVGGRGSPAQRRRDHAAMGRMGVVPVRLHTNESCVRALWILVVT